MISTVAGGRTLRGSAACLFSIYSSAMQKRVSLRTAAFGALTLALSLLPGVLRAQDMTGKCTTPDSIAIRGNSRVAESKIRTEGGITAGTPLNFPGVQRAIKAVYALNEFDGLDHHFYE